MSQNPHISLSEEQFHDTFNPILAESGDLLEFDDVKDLQPEHVWTIVDGDEEHECEDGEFRANSYALPGFHIVNKLGYIRSDTPWPHDNIEAIYFDVRD